MALSQQRDSQLRPSVSLDQFYDTQSLPESPSDMGDLSLSTAGRSTDVALKVVVRVRPPLPRELFGRQPFENTVLIDSSGSCITLSESFRGPPGDPQAESCERGLVYTSYQYTFDCVYGPDSEQQVVYDNTAREAVLSTLQGYNAAIIAYGQTGTGKTYTMDGALDGATRGIIPRAVEDIFGHIENDSAAHSKFLVRASYFQIYNEVISDLLKADRTKLGIRVDRKRGVYVEGLSEWVVRNPGEVYELMKRGAALRTTGVTRMNKTSSRSHAVFTIIIERSAMADNADMEQFWGLDRAAMSDGASSTSPVPNVQQTICGKLNLVDLAGSERVHITGATGRRLDESKKINASLSALGNVISALTDSSGSRQHIPYRDSKLTRFLEDSLGGNCKTTIIATMSPALDAFAESLSTLKFASRAKRIKNRAHVNEDLDQRTLLRRYERELKRLRSELQQRHVDLVDKRQLLALEEQKRRAEADKLAAMTALEARSREIMAEKEAKRRLEARITGLQSQLLLGGHKLEETLAFRKMLAKEQQHIRTEYEARFRELEKERVAGGADKLERYTQLLLKQRDIMMALTARLKRRDDQILNLQQELEAFDQHQKHLEDELDERTAQLISLRRADAGGLPCRDDMQTRPLNTPSDSVQAAGPTEVDLSATCRSPVSQQMGASNLTVSATDAGSPPTSVNGDNKSAENEQLALLQAENGRLLEQLSLRDADQERLPLKGKDELTRMTEQCRRLQKERAALKRILQAKIQSLVSKVGDALQSLHDEAGSDQVEEATTQLEVLKQLVAATVQAMDCT